MNAEELNKALIHEAAELLHLLLDMEEIHDLATSEENTDPHGALESIALIAERALTPKEATE